MGAGRVLVVDDDPDRLERARQQGAEPIDFAEEDPVEALRHFTGGPGPDRVVDAVGIAAAGILVTRRPMPYGGWWQPWL